MGNRSLDDFRDADGTASAEAEGEAAASESDGESGIDETADSTGNAETEAVDSTGDEDPGAADRTDRRADADDAGSAVSTYVWTASGGACAACGSSTPARWRQDDRLVCQDCKEW